MKTIKMILLFCCFGITSLIIASSYVCEEDYVVVPTALENVVEKAIKESDYCLLKKALQSTTFEQGQLISLIDVANDIITKKKNAIQQRQSTVTKAVLLKIAGPFTSLISLAIGSYLDPRGLGAMGTLVSVGTIIALFSQPEGAIERHAQLTGGYAAGCFAIGFALLEKYLWNSAKKIDKDLQKDYETAVSCKNLLISLI